MIRLLVLVAFLSQLPAAIAAEIKVLSAGGIKPPIDQLIAQFERATGHTIAIRFMGGPAVQREADGGAAFDLAISTTNVIDELARTGRVVAASKADIARAGVGVGVRAGAPKPDVSTVAAFRQTLLNAKSIAYAGDGTAGQHFEKVLDRLGIRKQIEAKAKKSVAADPKNSAVALVARGEADLAISAIAAIFAPGVELAGPLPAELQSHIHFAGALSAKAAQAEPAKAFLRFITAPAAASAFKSKGMEPVPQR